MPLNRGVVSDDEEDDMEPQEEPVDEEGEEIEDRGDDEEEDEEEEEGQDEYEKDGFIVDDVEEEPEDEEDKDSDEERHKKKKRKKRDSEKNFELDEDDYDLLQDANVRVNRPRAENKKFKRLKKAQRDSMGHHSGLFDEDEYDATGERKIQRSLFDDDGHLEDVPEEEEPRDVEYEDMGDEDDMADFIVDEEEVDEHGAPVRRKKTSKKKFRQAPGVTSMALQEAQEIFGDVEEFLKLRQTNLENRGRYEEFGGRERRLEDEFEPAIVAEKYMTEKDDQVRKIDVPERLQILEESTGPPPTDADAVAEEVKWICEQLDLGTVPLLGGKINEIEDGGAIRKEIENFLKFTHVQKFDVPFIAMYRRDDCLRLINGTEQDDSNRVGPSLKWHKALWTLQELDKKWLLLQKRKCALEVYYHKVYEEESRRVDDETRLSFNKQIFKSIVKALGEAESEREVDDVAAKFNLHFPPSEVDLEGKTVKRPSRKSRYRTCCRAGLWMAASKFGNSEQLGLRISLTEVGADEREDLKETPEEMALNFTCALFETPQSVLEGARHMAAVEISCEPVVRKHFRKKYFDKAVVSTHLTADGNAVIDSFHEFTGVKCLRNKPLREFVDAQWLLIQKAEEEKLIQVTIKLPEEDLNKEISEFRDYYRSDWVTKSAELWNEQRELILQDAIDNHFLPSLEKEARALLFCRAKSWLLSEYGKVLWDKVSVAPYQGNGSNANSDEEAAPRFMVCCWGPGKPATTFVVLDAYGEIVDVLEAGSINLRTHDVIDEQRKKNDQQNLLRFLAEHKPTRVVVGASNLSCTRLKDDINEFVFKILEDNPRDIHHELGEGGTIFMEDESIARLYEDSRISSDQLSGQSGIVKRAVALGRRLQNPLAMVAALCGPGREILSWELSPLQKYLSADEKYMMIEQIMVDVTNQVGLDLNLAANHEWMFAPLQFISGLGPRKAASLQRSIVRHSGLSSRKDLLTIHELGKKVFVNAAGFLRVRRSGLAATSSLYFDLLDDTRIHPESYGLAQDMAKDIYRKIFGDDNLDDEDSLEMAVDNLRERPDILKSFNVDAYAADQEDPVRNKRETLYLIKSEFIQGFQDRRKPYVQPTPDDDFFMITGETEETLVDGRPVQATVRRVQAQKAICALDSGLTGVLMKEEYSDDWRDGDLTEKLHEGDILTCKIKNIQKNRFLVYLTCRDDSRSNRHPTKRNLDPYYHEDSSSLVSDKEKARKEKELAKKHFKTRMIVHPCFQNITADEAMKVLADKDPGESVIRPSSRGPSHLTLTLKVYDGVYAHKDIVDGGKEGKDITSLLRIGKTLRIGEDSFEDLDEVMDRYVDPLVTHLKTMLNYRKFRRGTKAEVDELLRAEKKQKDKQKNLIVYSFGISHEHPGTFILSYVQGSNPHHEYIGLYPKGFKFRKKMFENIDKLVFYFQRHINDPMHESQSLQHVAAKVPMPSPARGGLPICNDIDARSLRHSHNNTNTCR